MAEDGAGRKVEELLNHGLAKACGPFVTTRRNDLAKIIRGTQGIAPPTLRPFSNFYRVIKILQGGVFLRKTPLDRLGLARHPLENRFSVPAPTAGNAPWARGLI